MILFLALKSIWTNDWSTDDQENWDESYFGVCKDKVFKVRGRPLMTSLNDRQ